MTEAEWLSCENPQKLMPVLRQRASDRKARLFACACCRHVWSLLPDERSRRAVETAERFAEGAASMEVAKQAYDEAWLLHQQLDHDVHACLAAGTKPVVLSVRAWAAQAAAETLANRKRGREEIWILIHAASSAAFAVRHSTEGASAQDETGAFHISEAAQKSLVAERRWQANILRDIFGNPFRPVVLDASWLTPTVVRLAQAIYDSSSFAAMPVLADALEEAGCESADILFHCRQPGEHARGCWCLDLLLGR
jgi:hypothetical protein